MTFPRSDELVPGGLLSLAFSMLFIIISVFSNFLYMVNKMMAQTGVKFHIRLF